MGFRNGGDGARLRWRVERLVDGRRYHDGWGRRCVDNLVDLRTITLRMFRPTYATRSVHFRRIRFRHTRIPDPVIDHCDLPPVIGQHICGGRVKKKGGRVKRTKWEKKTAGRGKIEFERGKKKKKRKRDGEFETRRFQPLAN